MAPATRARAALISCQLSLPESYQRRRPRRCAPATRRRDTVHALRGIGGYAIGAVASSASEVARSSRGGEVSVGLRFLLTSRRPTPPAATGGGRLVYAIGDVHGRIDLLERLLAK